MRLGSEQIYASIHMSIASLSKQMSPELWAQNFDVPFVYLHLQSCRFKRTESRVWKNAIYALVFSLFLTILLQSSNFTTAHQALG